MHICTCIYIFLSTWQFKKISRTIGFQKRWKVIHNEQFVTVTMRNNKRISWVHILLFILAVAKITETKHQFRVFAASEDVVYALLVIVCWLWLPSNHFLFFFLDRRNPFVVNTCKHVMTMKFVFPKHRKHPGLFKIYSLFVSLLAPIHRVCEYKFWLTG